MILLALQNAMRDSLLSGDETALSPGAEIYRNAYRSRLLNALRSGFEMTRRWLGEEAFDAAACHHIILTPPTGWTLDDYGARFDATLAELFARDPEVAELAWLEWHMQCAFAAPEGPTIDAAALTSGPLADGDWESMKIEFQPGLALRPIVTACLPLWQGLRVGTEPPADLLLAKPAHLMIWRNGLSPHFRVVDPIEEMMLQPLRRGKTFGAVCEELAGRIGPESAVTQIGRMLGQWLSDGMICRVSPRT